jgi:signal transduction histidine kinase/PAS domain-containing protein
MPAAVPQSLRDFAPDERAIVLEQPLDSLLEFTNASCGWIGLLGPDGRLTFPVRRGEFADAWLNLQLGQEGVWGFAVREGPTLLNDLPRWSVLGSPTLKNLLSCPLLHDGKSFGHVVLANRPHGFTSHDAAVVQGIAHLISKQLSGYAAQEPSKTLPALPLSLLDRKGEAVFVVDDQGILVYANPTWSEWTGFPLKELQREPAPFRFWVSHRELTSLAAEAEAIAGCGLFMEAASNQQTANSVFPFLRRDGSRLWCQVETVAAGWGGRHWTIAYLRQLPAQSATKRRASEAPTLTPQTMMALAEPMPFAAVLTDRDGRMLRVNPAAERLGFRLPSSSETVAGPLFRDQFALPSAAALEFLVHDSATIGSRHFGRLVLQGAGLGKGTLWVTYWLSMPFGPALPDGGFLFALAEDWEGLCPPDDLVVAWRRTAAQPAADWLTLLLCPGKDAVWWDARWEALTGLQAADVAGTPGEVVLDWLFPRQTDRDFVADLLQQPVNRTRGSQAMLNVLSPEGSRPLLCTFLPVPSAKLAAATPETEGLTDAWLMLIGEPQGSPAGGAHHEVPTARYVRQFARGLSTLLNHYFMAPIGLAEMALDRDDLPPQFAPWFEQILENCRQGTYLISSLQDLAASDMGDTALESLATVMREVLDERVSAGLATYEVVTDFSNDGVLARVNRRMIRVVLRHLLANAEQAMVNSPTRRITIRVGLREGEACCEIEDTGEGLEAADWTAALAPFYSTKGPFARDAAHAALPGTGLGLTVSHHLLALHGGRLELHSKPGQGTTAFVLLPRTDRIGGPKSIQRSHDESLRADPASETRGPHALPGMASALEPP